MSKYLILVLALLGLIGCSEPKLYYNRVDDNMLRLVGVELENPELAPGDTAKIVIQFAGDTTNITKEALTFGASWDIFSQMMGGSTVLDSQVVTPIYINDTLISKNTKSFIVNYIIPENIIKESSSIPEDWTSLLATTGMELPKDASFPNKSEVLAILSNPKSAKNIQMPVSFINALNQVFTVKYRLYINIEDSYMREFRGSIRYSNLHRDMGIDINNKIKIDSTVLIYGDNILRETIINDTIKIFKDSSDVSLALYCSPRDSFSTLIESFSDVEKSRFENYNSYIFYKDSFYLSISSDEIVSIESDSVDSPIIYSISRADTTVNSATFWTILGDNATGVTYRPSAITIKEFNVVYK